MKKDNEIKKINVIFWLFVAMMVIAFTMVVSSIADGIKYGDSTPDGRPTIEGGLYVDQVLATDKASSNVIVRPSRKEGVTLTAYPTVYDVVFTNDDGSELNNPAAVWTGVCKFASGLVRLFACLFGLLCAISFYKSFRRKDKFKSNYISYFTIVAILIIAGSLLESAQWILHSAAVDQLLPVDEPFKMVKHIEITRLFFGIALLFTARVLRITRNLQEEQELTI